MADSTLVRFSQDKQTDRMLMGLYMNVYITEPKLNVEDPEEDKWHKNWMYKVSYNYQYYSNIENPVVQDVAPGLAETVDAKAVSFNGTDTFSPTFPGRTTDDKFIDSNAELRSCSQNGGKFAEFYETQNLTMKQKLFNLNDAPNSSGISIINGDLGSGGEGGAVADCNAKILSVNSSTQFDFIEDGADITKRYRITAKAITGKLFYNVDSCTCGTDLGIYNSVEGSFNGSTLSDIGVQAGTDSSVAGAIWMLTADSVTPYGQRGSKMVYQIKEYTTFWPWQDWIIGY